MAAAPTRLTPVSAHTPTASLAGRSLVYSAAPKPALLLDSARMTYSKANSTSERSFGAFFFPHFFFLIWAGAGREGGRHMKPGIKTPAVRENE